MEYSCDPQDAYYRNVIVEGAIDWQSEIGGTGAIPISHRSPPFLVAAISTGSLAEGARVRLLSVAPYRQTVAIAQAPHPPR